MPFMGVLEQFIRCIACLVTPTGYAPTSPHYTTFKAFSVMATVRWMKTPKASGEECGLVIGVLQGTRLVE